MTIKGISHIHICVANVENPGVLQGYSRPDGKNSYATDVGSTRRKVAWNVLAIKDE
jgi:hypothetical protein